MFPVQLMAVRRSNKGILRPVFITEENSDYCVAVLDLFKRSTGRTRGEIENELKNIELKVQNPKILRGLALIMFRLSKFAPPSQMDSVRVRRTIFSLAKNPAVSPEERAEIIKRAAVLLVTEPPEIEGALYGDMEGNQILVSPCNLDPENLSRMFNLEQIETVMMKSLWVEISTRGRMNEFVRSLRSKGLMYRAKKEGDKYMLKVDGPVSIFEKSERYGTRLALFIRDVLKKEDFEINSLVSLKDGKRKKEYLYHIDDSVSDIIYREQKEEELPNFVNPEPRDIEVDGEVIIPDYSIEMNGTVYIFLCSRHRYEEDASMLRKLLKSGYRAELFCILSEGEKCPKGAMCFRDRADWWRIGEYLQEKYGKEKKSKIKEDFKVEKIPVPGELKDRVISHLNALYPDGQAMIEYLEFMGLPPEESLRLAGFKTSWKGLRLVVTGRLNEG